MGLTVLNVAYPFAPVTADPAGGAEQVLAQLDQALVAAGQRSIVVACEGSGVAGELVAIPATEVDIDAARRAEVHRAVRAAIAGVLAREAVDLVHLHGIDFADYLPPPGVGTLVTLHLPLDWYAADMLRPERDDLWLLPVSASQVPRAPARARLLPPIGNGVDVARYRPAETRGDHAVVIGRIAPEKGHADAIDAARLAGVPLVVAGPVFPYPEHRRYFDEAVAPRLDGERRWIGAVTGAAKRRLIAEARCLLIPSTAPETSSLVAMEALASGTPVIAYRSGALPDIVEHGVTGFIVDDVAGMAEAIGRIGVIDPAACRRTACARFALERTTAAYLDLYGRLAA
jgi:glycosyltransferase involved in cell wall biosynthesis